MSTPSTHRHRIGPELTDFAFRLPVSQRQQMQRIAAHRGWSEAEAMRRAVALFLAQNSDLLQVISMASDHSPIGVSPLPVGDGSGA